MNKLILITGMVTLLALGQSTFGMAEVPITITLGGTQYWVDSSRDVDDDLYPSGAIEYRFGERWAAEAFIMDGDTDGDNGFDADMTQWHLDALYYLKPYKRFHPYLAIGGGQLKRDWDVPTGNLDNVDEQLNGGAGVRYYLDDHWSLRGDARYVYGLDDSDSNFALTLGVSYGFAPPPGRSKAPAPMPAPAPEPEPEPVPVDSDGDGVMDDADQCPGTPANTRVDERGCEIKFVRGESAKLQVNFAFDSAAVDKRYLKDIEDLADFLKRHQDLVVEIEAHTDSKGSEAYNQGLSQRRANSVIKILEEDYGVPADRLMAHGYGESKPVASNDTDQGRAQNRRVMASLEVKGDE
jgi:OOP family OmpA-OmpF porin